MSFLHVLRKSCFFDGLEQEKALFLSRATRLCLKKGERLFSRGDPGDACYYMEKGLVRIFGVAGDGKEPMFFLRRHRPKCSAFRKCWKAACAWPMPRP